MILRRLLFVLLALLILVKARHARAAPVPEAPTPRSGNGSRASYVQKWTEGAKLLAASVCNRWRRCEDVLPLLEEVIAGLVTTGYLANHPEDRAVLTYQLGRAHGKIGARMLDEARPEAACPTPETARAWATLLDQTTPNKDCLALRGVRHILIAIDLLDRSLGLRDRVRLDGVRSDEGPWANAQADRRILLEELKLAMRRLYPPRHFQFEAGLALRGRLFTAGGDCQTFERGLYTGYRPDSACPRLTSPLSAALRLEWAIFPLAHLWTPRLRGLGLGGRALWAPRAGVEGATAELLIEAGPRWQSAPPGAPRAVSGLASLSYGLHQIAVSTPPDGAAPGLPGTRYQYVDLGLGGQLPLFQRGALRAGLTAEVHYRAIFAFGEISLVSTGFGALEAGHGLRVALCPLLLSIRERYSVRLLLEYDWARSIPRLKDDQRALASAFGPPARLAGWLDDHFLSGSLLFGFGNE